VALINFQRFNDVTIQDPDRQYMSLGNILFVYITYVLSYVITYVISHDPAKGRGRYGPPRKVGVASRGGAGW
jgi:hypothetical protein